MPAQNELAKAVAFALEVIKLQQGEITSLKLQLFSLRDSVDSGKPPLSYTDAERAILSDLRESGKELHDIIPLLNEHLKKVRSLAK